MLDECLWWFEFLGPFEYDAVDVDILVVHVDHSHSGNGSRRGKLKIIGLEDEVDIGSEGDTLTSWEGEKMVVVEHAVQGLNPLRVNIAITDDPVQDVLVLFDHLSC